MAASSAKQWKDLFNVLQKGAKELKRRHKFDSVAKTFTVGDRSVQQALNFDLSVRAEPIRTFRFLFGDTWDQSNALKQFAEEQKGAQSKKASPEATPNEDPSNKVSSHKSKGPAVGLDFNVPNKTASDMFKEARHAQQEHEKRIGEFWDEQNKRRAAMPVTVDNVATSSDYTAPSGLEPPAPAHEPDKKEKKFVSKPLAAPLLPQDFFIPNLPDMDEKEGPTQETPPDQTRRPPSWDQGLVYEILKAAHEQEVLIRFEKTTDGRPIVYYGAGCSLQFPEGKLPSSPKEKCDMIRTLFGEIDEWPENLVTYVRDLQNADNVSSFTTSTGETKTRRKAPRPTNAAPASQASQKTTPPPLQGTEKPRRGGFAPIIRDYEGAAQEIVMQYATKKKDLKARIQEIAQQTPSELEWLARENLDLGVNGFDTVCVAEAKNFNVTTTKETVRKMFGVFFEFDQQKRFLLLNPKMQEVAGMTKEATSDLRKEFLGVLAQVLKENDPQAPKTPEPGPDKKRGRPRKRLDFKP